jgi:hypothetical protein
MARVAEDPDVLSGQEGQMAGSFEGGQGKARRRGSLVTDWKGLEMLNVLPVVRWVEWFLSPSLAPDSKNGKRWLGGIPPPQNREMAGWLNG